MSEHDHKNKLHDYRLGATCWCGTVNLRWMDLRWKDAAPVEQQERYEFYVRLISELSKIVSYETMDECIAKALPCHGVKRSELTT